MRTMKRIVNKYLVSAKWRWYRRSPDDWHGVTANQKCSRTQGLEEWTRQNIAKKSSNLRQPAPSAYYTNSILTYLRNTLRIITVYIIIYCKEILFCMWLDHCQVTPRSNQLQATQPSAPDEPRSCPPRLTQVMSSLNCDLPQNCGTVKSWNVRPIAGLLSRHMHALSLSLSFLATVKPNCCSNH